MFDAGKRFAAAMGDQAKKDAASTDDQARMEAVAKGLHMAMRNLLLEISQKPVDKQTDAEKTFVKAFVSITILGIIANPIGGIKL